MSEKGTSGLEPGVRENREATLFCLLGVAGGLLWMATELLAHGG